MFVSRHATRRLTQISSRWLIPASAHLITSQSQKRVESPFISRGAAAHSPFCSRYRPLTTATMASLESITQSLATLSIQPAAVVNHDATDAANWREALRASADAPESFETLKTMVYKPKTAKTATPVPLVIIARESTEVNSNAVGKKLNLKEVRVASEDLLKEFFSLDKDSRTRHFTF